MTQDPSYGAGSETGATGEPRRRWPADFSADLIDVVVYVLVLNLAIALFPRVISESFALSLLTALLLKVTLEVVLLLKGRVVRLMRSASTRRGTLLAATLLWVVAAGSKLLVLELIDFVFGESVSLGGFISVTALVIALLLARSGVRYLLSAARSHS